MTLRPAGERDRTHEHGCARPVAAGRRAQRWVRGRRTVGWRADAGRGGAVEPAGARPGRPGAERGALTRGCSVACIAPACVLPVQAGEPAGAARHYGALFCRAGAARSMSKLWSRAGLAWSSGGRFRSVCGRLWSRCAGPDVGWARVGNFRRVTETRTPRLIPTGYCFCGCKFEVTIGSWFVQGHDIRSGAALRVLEGLSLPERLVQAGFGPERSVVDEAVQRAGWVRCAGCTYAGPPAGLAAHTRGGGCATPAQADREEPAAAQESATAQEPAAEPAIGARARPAQARAGDSGPGSAPLEVEAGPARGLALPGPEDPLWDQVPLFLRQTLAVAAHRLVTPERGSLTDKARRRLLHAVRAAARTRMSGAHWQVLLSAPREDFGSARSTRAAAVFEVLEKVVAEHVAPRAEDGPGGWPEDTAHSAGEAGAADFPGPVG